MSYKVFNKKEIKKGVKIRRALVAGTLAVTLSFGAFLEGTLIYTYISNKRSIERAKNRTTSSTVTTDNSNTVAKSSTTDPLFILEDDDYVETSIDKTPISIESVAKEEFSTYVDSLDIEYPYSEHFQIDEALKSESNYKIIENHSQDIRDENNKFNLDKLADQIYENSNAYYENLGSMKAFYNLMSKSDIKEICKTILETIELEAQSIDIDEDRLSCFLSSLKMFTKSGVSMASVSKDGVLSINPTMLKFGEIIAQNGNNDRNVLVHEIIHMIQSSCQENPGAYKLGTSYKDESLAINPLYHSWLIEATAEQERINLTGDENIIYEAQIGYRDSLEFVLALKDEYTIGEIEDLNLLQDSETFYKLFNSNREEIIEMLYSIEIIQAEPEEFKNAYKNAYGEELTSEKILEVKRKLKGSICSTLTKEFYKNLCDKIESGMTLEDAFYLIKIFESDMFGHIRYDNPVKRDLGMSYFATYNDIQSKFFSSIQSENFTYEDILEYYLNYSTKVTYNGKKRENYSLTWLSEDKKEFLKKCKDNVYSKTVVSPYSTVESLDKKNFN